jgi:hypothetical protein
MAIQETISEGIEPVAQQLALAYEEQLREMLIDKGKESSGTLVNSIRTSVRSDGSKAVIEVYAEDYLRFVDQGRAPGRFPPIDKIRSWVAIQGISEEAVFPIARKIATQGIQATPVVNPTIDKVLKDFLPVYEKELEKIAGAVLVNDVFSATNTKGQILPKSLTL